MKKSDLLKTKEEHMIINISYKYVMKA